MKVILTTGQYTFTPASNQIVFNMGGSFKPENLYAVIDTTTGKLIYSASGTTSGFGGSFSTTIFTNDTLTYASSNVGQSPSDILQCIYEDPNISQNVIVNSGSITSQSNTYDAGGNGIGSYTNPITGQLELNTNSAMRVHDGDQTPILSTVDPASLRDGLDVNMLTSSYGGQINQVLPPPFSDYALSMGILNNGTLRAPKMNINDQLEVDISGSGTVDVNVVGSTSIPVTVGGPYGQGPMINSLPVAIASDQSAIPVTVSSPINATIVGDDVLGTMLTGKRNSQLEIPFYTVPTSTFLTTTLTNATAVASAGHTVYQLSASAGSALAKAVSVQTVTYRPGHEIYTMFTAAFINAVGGTISHRIGLYDVSDGFFVGINATNFCIGKRTGGIESTVLQGSFNVDNLLGTTGSKFTRNGVPEPLNFGVSNLYRIRFAWLGSGNIYFEVFSPDGEWVLFHNIQQPNSSFLPSLTNPNLPMTLEVSRPSGTTVAGLATACWAAGTTSDLQPITSTLTDQTLATLNRSVIAGVTTGGGGGYVNAKVTPSGALTTETTVSGTVATSLAELNITGQGAQTASGNNALLASAGTGSLDANGYRSGFVQVVSTATGGNYIFEASQDNVNFQTMVVINASNVNGTTISSSITASATSLIYAFPITARYIRLRIITSLTGGSIQCFTRLSQTPYQPVLMPVGQATASNLNAAVTGTVAVTQATASNLQCAATVAGATLGNAQINDITSAAITSTQTSASISLANVQSISVAVFVTAISGSGAAMDVMLQQSHDGTNFFDWYQFERITATGQYYSPTLRVTGQQYRIVRTVSGTTPSITNAISRLSKQTQVPDYKRVINRTIDPNTLNSTTSSLLVECTQNMQLVVSSAAGATVNPVIKLQGSEDNSNWYDLNGMSITALPSTTLTVDSASNEAMPKFIRAITSTAGVGAVLNYVTIKGSSQG